MIYGGDDVVVEPGVVQLDGGHMPVNYRIGSISPVRDDRGSEEQILEHITGALQEAVRQPSGAVRAAVSRANEQASVRSSHAGSGLRVLIGLMLTAVIAFAWYSYGSEAKLLMAGWAPQASLASLLSLIKPQDQAQPSRAATANEAASKAVIVAQNLPQEVRAEGVSTATDMAEWLQTAARDLANVEQAIQQLKASQEQIVRDNAELADRLKATEEQVARDNAAVADRLTATEAQIARENAKNVDELKAAQSQMAHDNAALSSELKAALEQMKGAIAKASKPTERASEQNPRPKPSPQIVTRTIRPAVRAPRVRAPQATHKSTGFGQL